MEKPFICINGRYIAVAHIIEICIQYDKVTIVTDEMIAEGVGESGWVATNAQLAYWAGTPTYDAIVAWANCHSETI